ncbi:MAG: hypothetical protein ACI4YB_11755 [Oscillospiraceae bacterium]
MARNKCPLCGGRILNGECAGCGFRLPDEEKLSAPYNLDPEDDRPDIFEPAPEKYRMPEADPEMAQKYGGAAPVKEKSEAQAPNIKVAPTQPNYPAQNNNQGWQNPYGSSAQQNTPQNNPQQGWQNPYNNNPTNNSPRRGVYPKSKRIMMIGLVMLLIISFGTPLFGFIGIVLSKTLGEKLGEAESKLFRVAFTVSLLVSVLFRG